MICKAGRQDALRMTFVERSVLSESVDEIAVNNRNKRARCSKKWQEDSRRIGLGQIGTKKIMGYYQSFLDKSACCEKIIEVKCKSFANYSSLYERFRQK